MSEEESPYFAHSVEIASCDQQVIPEGATFDASCAESEEPSPPPKKRSGPFEFEDGYETYVDDTFGYTYDAWDTVEPGRQAHHDRILAMDEGGLGVLDTETLGDLERFALARAWRASGRPEMFLSVVDRVLQEPRDDQALEYEELEIEALRWAIHQGHEAWASEGLERLESRSGGGAETLGLRALWSASRGAWVEAMKLWEESVAVDPREAEACLEIAQTLVRLKERVRAQGWLERAEASAHAQGDRALLVDIALCRERVY